MPCRRHRIPQSSALLCYTDLPLSLLPPNYPKRYQESKAPNLHGHSYTYQNHPKPTRLLPPLPKHLHLPSLSTVPFHPSHPTPPPAVPRRCRPAVGPSSARTDRSEGSSTWRTCRSSTVPKRGRGSSGCVARLTCTRGCLCSWKATKQANDRHQHQANLEELSMLGALHDLHGSSWLILNPVPLGSSAPPHPTIPNKAWEHEFAPFDQVVAA